MKQTAVDFLIEQIIDKQPAGFYVIDSQEECYKLFEKARQMEKEQIIECLRYAIEQEYYYKTWANCASTYNAALNYYNEFYL